ncbi:hypothetical protein Agub_g4470 [Astrephomene gubernaculifera]|uniref:Bidirectional sugar transporter SWEET n=1 Tax=Astrephomene gubernaculifera TaxID=47775 RepID=A0AAD3DKR6_9CHLO|nr:hypothetical protein Agub_g4470 [Astrephomene gubernaculifera]
MAESAILEKVVPALGAVVSTVMYMSPLKAVLRASKEKSLGDLNPLPFGVTIANTIAWLGYGLLKHDPFVTTPNAIGVLIAVFMTLTAYGLADEHARYRMRIVVCLTSAIMPLLGVVTAFGGSDAKTQQGLWGLAGNVVCLIYYAAPLTSMLEVIRSRNSASILVPLTMMNTLNAALWTTYGVAVRDPYIWLPNGIGLVLSLMQVALRVVFPAKAGSSSVLPSHQHHASFPHSSDPAADPRSPLVDSGGAKYSRLDESFNAAGVVQNH